MPTFSPALGGTALLLAGALVGGPSALVDRSWSAPLGEHVGAGAPAARDPVDTTATAPDTVTARTYEAGAVLYARTDDVPVRARPAPEAGTVTLVRTTDPLVFLGKSEAGALWVQFPGGQGWIDARRVTREWE